MIHRKYTEREDSIINLAQEAGYSLRQIGNMIDRTKSSVGNRARRLKCFDEEYEEDEE